MSWSTPKTDWQASDTFSITDYNRIKNNILMIFEYIVGRYGDEIEYYDMGEDIVSYSGYYDVNMWNAIEENVELISSYKAGTSGLKQTFYPNGQFVKYTELNRIEGLTKMFENEIQGWILGRLRLPMVLGRDRRLMF